MFSMKYDSLDYLSVAILPGNGEIACQGYTFTFVKINVHLQGKTDLQQLAISVSLGCCR